MGVEQRSPSMSEMISWRPWSGAVGARSYWGESRAVGSERSAPDDRGLKLRDAELRERGFGDLPLPPASVTLLAGDHFHSGRDFDRDSVRDLETRDFDELKRWIGAPDRLWRGGRPRRLQCNQLCGPEDPRLNVSGWDALAPTMLRSIEAVADAYLFADSRLVREYKGVLEKLYGSVTVRLVRAGRIEIGAGAVFEVGGDPTVVFADEVILQQGGRLRFTTYAHFSTARFTKLNSVERLLLRS